MPARPGAAWRGLARPGAAWRGGVARGASDRAQPRPLDGTAGARRGNRHDQDAQAALLRSRRTAHPLGTALDPAPPQALALGRAAGSRARAATGATAPGLTPAHSAGPGPSLAPACPRTPRAPSRPRPQRPRATAPRSGTARRTPAPPPYAPPARHPAPSCFDRWIWAKSRNRAGCGPQDHSPLCLATPRVCTPSTGCRGATESPGWTGRPAQAESRPSTGWS